jgi:hypothetical protein
MKPPKRHVKRSEELEYILLGANLQIRGAVMGHYFNIIEHTGNKELMFDKYEDLLLNNSLYPVHLKCLDINVIGLRMNKMEKIVCVLYGGGELELKRLYVDDLLTLAKIGGIIERLVFNL